MNKVAAFSLQYIDTGAAGLNDDAGMDRDAAVFAGALEGYINKTGDLISRFVDQARDDLHTN